MLNSALSRYDRRSLVVLALLTAISVAVTIVWNDLFRANLGVVNWFLIAIWVFMIALLSWDVRPAQDLALAVVALACGFGFEWWGTHTQLWSYFTGESPPVWILPAWPVAALATARFAFGLEWVLSRRPMNWSVPYWLLMALFMAGMIRFLWPSIGMTSSQVAVVLMGLAVAVGRSPRRDLSLFLAGTLLGIFLEYWGTSRACWTYYTKEIPPPITVAAHGFAQVAYCRILALLDRGRAGVGLSGSVRAREYAPPGQAGGAMNGV